MLRLLVTIALAGVLGVLAWGTLAITRNPSAPLRLGLSPWPGAEPFFLAEQQGLFAAHGLAVELVEYASFADVASAYAHGDIDALLGSTHEVVTVRARSQRRPVVVRATDESLGGDLIVVRTDEGGLASLAGQRVGVEVASIGIEVLARALAKVDLDLDDVTIVPLEPSGIPEAFTAGTIAAAVTYQPFADAILAAGGRTVFTSAELKEPLIALLAVDATWLARHPTGSAKLDRVFSQAVAWIAAHPDEAAAQQGARLGLTAAEFAAQAAQVRLLDSAAAAAARDQGRILHALRRTAALLQRLQMIDTIDLDGVVDGT